MSRRDFNKSKQYTKTEVDTLKADKANKANLVINVTQIPPEYNILNCVTDGITDCGQRLQLLFNYIVDNLSNDFVEIYFPSTVGANTVLSNQKLDLHRGNVVFRFDSILKFGNFSMVEPFCLRIYGTAAEGGKSNVFIKGVGKILCNGDQTNYGENGFQLTSIKNFTIEGIKFSKGYYHSCIASHCQDGVIDRCEFTDAVFDNGLAVNGLVNFNGKSYNDTDPDTWNNIVVKNCKGHDNADLGISAFTFSNVTFKDCECYNNGILSGGGFSAESNSVTDTTQKYYFTAINCIARDNKGYGFWVDDYIEATYHNCESYNNAANDGNTENHEGHGYACIGNEYKIVYNNCISKNNSASGIRHATDYLSKSRAVTFQDTGNIAILNNHGLLNGTIIQFVSITTTTGISALTNYYVVNPTANTFQISDGYDGPARNLTNDGTGALSKKSNIIVRGGIFEENLIASIFDGSVKLIGISGKCTGVAAINASGHKTDDLTIEGGHIENGRILTNGIDICTITGYSNICKQFIIGSFFQTSITVTNKLVMSQCSIYNVSGRNMSIGQLVGVGTSILGTNNTNMLDWGLTS